MPLNDRDVNVPRRNSVTSSMSNNSRPPPRQPPAAMIKPDLTTAPGVMSMLKSSTEVDALMMPGSRFSAQTRASNRRSCATSRLSTGSSHSHASRPASGQHSHQAWPSISSGGRRMSIASNFSNLNAPQHYLDHLPPPSLSNLSDTASLPPPAPHFRDNGRSFSLTNSIHHGNGLANYRSLSSLRGQEPYPRPRSPYRYPTRLKRPGYRPSSPAMSDVTGSMSSRMYHHRLGSGLRVHHGPHSSYGSHTSHAPSLTTMARPSPLYYGPRNRSSPSIASLGPLEHMPGTYPPSLPASRQGTPSILEHAFPIITPSNSVAAASAQHSSDPPSSTPPTPRHQPGRVVEPTVIANGHVTSRTVSAASSTIPTYYDYSENFEPTVKTASVAPPPVASPPPIGFVHRIRTILEEQRVMDPGSQVDSSDTKAAVIGLATGDSQEVHELPASPVVKRITRELIKANLQISSESEPVSTPSITTALKEGPQDSSDHNALIVASAGVDEEVSRPIHERAQSKISGHGSIQSDTTTATAALDYALHYSPTYNEHRQTSEFGSTMSDMLRNYEREETHMSTVIEEPTEPVTIATVDVEVAAPTPTQPQVKWRPNLDTSTELLRPQSAVAPCSSQVMGSREAFSRHSTPLNKDHLSTTITTSVDLALPPSVQAFIARNQETERLVVRHSPSSHTATSVALAAVPPDTTMGSNGVKRLSTLLPPPSVLHPSVAASPVSPLSQMNVEEFNTFSSPVSPLVSPDLPPTKRDSNVSSIWSYRKPVPRRPDSPASISTRNSVRDVDAIEHGTDTNSTTDLRFSALGIRSAVRQLDDVKEEPSLETSSSDLAAPSFKFPLPKRKSSLANLAEFRRSQETKRRASIDIVKHHSSHSQPRASSIVPRESRDSTPVHVLSDHIRLSDLREIPSLHFSRVDLFAKLNEAFGPASAPSDEHASKRRSGLFLRPESTGVMRQKYRSFFESLDNMANNPVNNNENLPREDLFRSKAPQSGPDCPKQKKIVLPKIQQWTPDDLVAEIDRLSIPSINGLTQRLSEMLPSLRRYYGEAGEPLDGDDETVRSALDEIRRLGRELMPDGDESSSSMGEYSGELPDDTSCGSRKSSKSSKSDSVIQVRTRARSASSPGCAPGTPLAELDAHEPAMLRSQSLRHETASRIRASIVASERSRRSFLSSPPEARPWNLETSYPWASSIPAIDISLPAPNLRRDPIKPRPSRLRLQDDVIDSAAFTGELSAITAATEATESTSAADTFSNTASRRRANSSKRSILGSISRRIKIPRSVSIDNSGYATGPDLLRGEPDRTVDPGDRYPTTGLSPPSALNIDEVRSFFSDDSSHMDTASSTRGGVGIGLRKRFSNLRSRVGVVSRTHSALEARSTNGPITGPVLRRSNSFFFATTTTRAGARSTTANQSASTASVLDAIHTEDQAAGMPKTEVRAKKLVNRMRTLWYKGGELLRTLSRKRKGRQDQDWDSEDGASTDGWERV